MKRYYVRGDGRAFTPECNPYCVVTKSENNSLLDGYAMHTDGKKGASISVSFGTWKEVSKKEARALIGYVKKPKNRSGVSNKLLRAVEAIDVKAAEYLRNPHIGMTTRYKDEKKIKNLSSLMVWYETPQGHAYWSDINNEMSSII